MSEDEENNIKHEVQFNEEHEKNEDDIMKILIATDIHLGYEQTTKRVQEDDSFKTFEEILKYAHTEEVDMILLGGDLFHEAKPPHNVVMRCLELLRTYCLGDRTVKISFLNNPEEIFGHCNIKIINYEDPNLNIAIPIFSINGNHDDPSYGAIGSMDVLSATGFINYFGKWQDVTQVEIPPIILRKGSTIVALYGLGYMNDQRLSRLMRTDKFTLLQSPELKDAFNIFVLHQNRAQHSPKSYVSEELLPDFLNLVIWGHEHECRIIPEESKLKPRVFISQPGSSVATSLSQGESVEKYIGILNIYKDQFKMDTIKLKTVRPFVFEDLVLSEFKDEITIYRSRSEAVEEFVDKYIENKLIPLAVQQHTGHPQQPEKPLLRLRIFYNNDHDIFDVLRLSQKYYHVAANPNDIIIFRKCSTKLKKKDIETEEQDFGGVAEIFCFEDSVKDWKQTVQGGMTEFFSQSDNMNKLTVLSYRGLHDALSRFVDANDTKAFHDLVNFQMEKTVDHLENRNYDDKKEILDAILEYRNVRLSKSQETREEEEMFLNSRKNLNPKTTDSFKNDDKNGQEVLISNDGEDINPIPTRGRGRGKSRGRGAGTGKSTKTGKDTLVYTKQVNRGRSKNTTALDISTISGNKPLISWKKHPQNNSNQGSLKQTALKVVLDSDSD